jgi:formylglycine-generating enzyme required for sulfatase activity
VNRGGGWYDFAERYRPAFRGSYAHRYGSFGFRLAFSPEQ